jgi:molybdate transport system substrate-binding protein
MSEGTMRIWTLLSLVAALGVASAPVQAAEITVLGGQGVVSALYDLAPAFERATGHKLIVVQEADLDGKVNSNAPADLVATGPQAIDSYIAKGKVVGSRTDFARAGVGVAVKAGAPRPDISTADAYKRAMLAAKSIAYSRGGSGNLTHKAMEKLGIADQIAGKTRRTQNVPVAELVANGEVEIGMHQINVILPVKGADYIGPLPEGLQDYVLFSLGVLMVSKQPEAAKAFTTFAIAPASAALIGKSGMEPWREAR